MNHSMRRRKLLARSFNTAAMAAANRLVLGYCPEGALSSATIDSLSKVMLDLQFPMPRPETFGRLIHKLSHRNEPELMYGFVLAESQGKLVLQTDNMRDILAVGLDESLKFEKCEFRTYLNEVIQSQSGYSKVRNVGYLWEIGPTLEPGMPELTLDAAYRDLIVAFWCSSCGYPDDAHYLLRRGESTAPGQSRRVKVDNFLVQFKQDVLLLSSKRIVASMANPCTSRAEAIARLNWILSLCPDEDWRNDIVEVKTELELAKQVEDRLRDVNYQGLDPQPEFYVQSLIEQRCYAKMHTSLIPKQGPLQRIMQLGAKALPSLKEILPSRAATRCVTQKLNGEPPLFRWLTLGEVGTLIADQIERDIGVSQE